MAQANIERLLRFFQMGVQAKRSREQSEAEKERLKLDRERAQHAAKAASLKEKQFLFESTFGRDVEANPDIELPSGGTTRAPTLSELVARARQESEAKNTRTLSPGLAQHLGLPEGETTLPSNISGQLPAPPIELPESLAGDLQLEPGSTKKGLVDVAVDMFKQRAQTHRTRLQQAGAGQRAATMAGAIGGDTIANWATMLNTGQRKPTDIPQALRGAVNQHMIERKLGTMTPGMKDKIDSFNAAAGALDSLADDLANFKAARNKADARGIYVWGLQYMADREALTRLVGRGTGERGVFTDRDSDAFMALTSTNPLITAFDPSQAELRLKNAYRTMQNVRTRELTGFEQMTGGMKLPVGELAVPPSISGQQPGGQQPIGGTTSSGIRWMLENAEEPSLEDQQ